MTSKRTKNLGSVIRRIRKQSKLTQEKLSFLSEVDRSYISLIELGTSSPSFDVICALCIGLNIDLVELMRQVEIEQDNAQPNS